jgi:cell division protein FtsI (penicillin-binding protein 3)
LKLSDQEKISFREQFDRKSRDRKLAMWLDKEIKDLIMDWWLPYSRKHKIPRNALFFVSDYQRSYPYGKLLGQVLHTIQGVKDDKTHQAIPTGGLELYFNHYLKGKPGKRRLMRSPRNAFEMGEVISRPENGADIYLSINHCLQAIAEEEIAKGVKKFKAKSGWAVMMNPYTGEILALAQYPFFNLSEYQSYFNDKEMVEHTKIKGVTDAHEPGSVMKALTMVVALKANEELKKRGEPPLFDPEEMMPTSNSRFPGRTKPLPDTHFHAFLNMNMAIQKSSNIYPARLMEKVVARLGNEWYRAVLHDVFGFGQKTHIELPSESGGLLPKPGKKHPNGTFEWSVPTPFSLAIGHNILINSIQLVRAFSTLANGGYLVQPTIIRKIVKKDEDGKEKILIDNTRPERIKAFPKVLEPEIIELVVKAMKYSTKPGGTSRRADVWGYTDAGKSGTAKKIVNGVYVDNYVSDFIGFVPVKNPAFVITVAMDEPEYGFLPNGGPKHHGGVVAAPIFREIARRSLEYLGVPPDDPYGYAIGDPRFDPNKADWMPENRMLKEKYEKWNK